MVMGPVVLDRKFRRTFTCLSSAYQPRDRAGRCHIKFLNAYFSIYSIKETVIRRTHTGLRYQ